MLNTGTVNLFYEDITLRRYEFYDYENLKNSFLTNKNNFTYLIPFYVTNERDLYNYLMNILNNYNNLSYYNWLITKGEIILGTCSYHNVEIENDKVELGLIIDEKFQGRGIGKKCVKCLVRFAFEELKCQRIEVKIMEDNLASNNLFKSLNFKFEGKRYKCLKIGNTYYDLNIYSLINT